ncbi:PAS domain-containing sensor histidine kinase [Hymenobacter volaticus]|uniref:histidine kinase n=1 Tax=Hymenobacter volaticus TaxID=2932254 RepID=A0ABY4GEX9_9BACT|nr:PAS domain-containing protein [Hymenobacter volaticus]UOQ69350.1 PAS domain-containing sensor histidine kinase [Hymenobacter volaticus]
MPSASPPLDLLPVFNAQPGATLLLSPEWVIVGASDDYLAATLTERATLVGQHIFAAFPDNPDTPEANAVANVRASLAQVMATKQFHEMAPQHYDVPDPAQPGRFVERHWQPRHTPVLDAQGQVQFIIQSVQDITARRLAERQLRESQAREQAARAEAERERAELRRVFAEAPIAMGVLRGPDFVVEWANPRMGQIWGRPLDQIVGRPHFAALPDLAGQGFEAVFAGVLQTGEPCYFRELLVTIAQAQQSYQGYFNITYQPTYDEAGHITGLICSAVEVTDQVRARQQVQTLNEELAAINEELRASNEEYLATNAALSQTQQQLEAARAETEGERQRLYQVLMRMPANIALLRGPEHIYDLVNAEYERLFPARTTLGRTIREVIPDIEGQGFYELFDRVYETGEPFYDAETEVWADFAGTGEPQRRYYRTTFEPIRDAQGQVTEVLNFAVDITAQVEARQQVEQLNQELEARVQARTQEALALQADLLEAAQRQVQVRESFYQVFEQTPAAVSLLRGPTYRFEYVNPVYQQVFAGRQLVGHDFADALPDATAQGYLAMLEGVYHTGETFFGAEVPFVSEQPDTSPHTVYFNFTYQAYRENGEIVGISTFALDVTEQVLARQEREAQRQQLYTVFEQAPIGIAIQAGPDLVYEFHNPGYLWMVPDRQLVGKRFFDVFPEMAGTNVETLLRHVYETGETQQEHELLIPVARADGSAELEDRYFTVVYQARRDEQGHINGILAFVMEVTEQVHARQQVQDLNEELAAINEELTAANEELHQSNTQLTRTNVDLDTFVYTASHDLKAPITNIESIVLALRDTLPTAVQQDDVVAHLLELLDTTVTRFRLTIGQLTDISKLQLAHAGPTEPVRLAQAIENVRLDLLPTIAAADTQLTVEVDPELVVLFSPANLRSIVYNLLGNAIKYRAADRPNVVQVRATPEPNAVVLTVQDNGLGMSAVQQRQLFGLFQRLHTHVEGTGVGLYITKRLVENAGGIITVQSQPGAGTTFTIMFPA